MLDSGASGGPSQMLKEGRKEKSASMPPASQSKTADELLLEQRERDMQNNTSNNPISQIKNFLMTRTDLFNKDQSSIKASDAPAQKAFQVD